MAYSSESDSAATPYEAVPALAANEAYIDKMVRLRELTLLKHELFNADARKGPLGEYEMLKRECAAMQLVAGEKSVAFGDLRVISVAGGTTKGKVTGESIITTIEQLTGHVSTDQYRAIAESAKECDVQALVNSGISPQYVAQAKLPDAPRAGSIRAEIIGPKSGAGEGSVAGSSMRARSGAPQ